MTGACATGLPLRASKTPTESASTLAAAEPPASLPEREDRDSNCGCDHTCERGKQDCSAPQRMRLGNLLGLERWELGLQSLDVQLEKHLGKIDVLEPVGAELAHRHASHLVCDQPAGDVREQHLPTVCGRSDPRRAVHPQPDIALLFDYGLARMQPHAHTHLGALGPFVLGKSLLRDDRGSQSRVGAREGEEERVSLVVDLSAFAFLCGCSQDAPLLGENRAVALPQLLEQPRRALDVREQEGDGAAVQLRREPPCREASTAAELVSNPA